MSPSATPPRRLSHGASPDFERRVNAFLDVARDEDNWSISESDESDGSESDAYASYDSDDSDDSDFSDSEVDLRELETLIARLHAHGAEFVRPKTTQKHRDIHTLVAGAPRASRPTIIPRGSIRDLPEPIISNLHSEGVRAQREGLRWMKPPGRKGTSRDKKDFEKSGRKRARMSPVDGEENDDDDAKLVIKKRKRRPTETQAYQDRIANASRPWTEEDRKRRGLEIQWAQRLAALREAEDASKSDRRDEDDAADNASDVAETASAPNSAPCSPLKESRKSSYGRVSLTVCWRARTRARSGVQPTPVRSVIVDVFPGETCVRFMTRMVTMPPGGVYIRDTQLSWGDCILDPMQELGGARTGPWELDLRREKPFELVLRVPVGAALAHRALREAAGETNVVSGKDVGDELETGRGIIGGSQNARDVSSNPANSDGSASADGASGASGGSRSKFLFAKSAKDLSNRALHPGRTDPQGMAALLKQYDVVKDDTACSLVDVGSGDGRFALGLARAFPNAGVCGIEVQRNLYEESLVNAGRDCNFICGLAEKELEKCIAAKVIMSTTHNFDASSIESIVRVAARLPSVTHLVVGESSLCTPRCKAVVGPCCCFVPLGSEEVPTHWGNSHLTFSLYQRVARWVLDANSAERVSERAKLEKIDDPAGDPAGALPSPPRRTDDEKRRKNAETLGKNGETRSPEKIFPEDDALGNENQKVPSSPSLARLESARALTPRTASRSPSRRFGGTPQFSEKRQKSPKLALSPGCVNVTLMRTVV
jgi:hypothetical protein